MNPQLVQVLIIAGTAVAVLLMIGLVVAKLYTRASKEISFVRTGMGGQRVIMNGGALVVPVIHEVIPVNMNTLRLDVKRANDQALITKDRMRVDVTAEFYVRAQPSAESIANAAQTLGQRTMQPEALKELVEGKFVDALRSVAAEMAMEELHEQRTAFVQKVQQAVTEDLLKNGLELESVSLTGLDQTSKDFFNPDNAFDAEGLTKLTEAIEARRKKRNDIEQETQVLIERKNLEAEQQKLEISREEEYARLAQEREVEIRRASQQAEIARERAEKRQSAETADITAQREIEEARIAMEQQLREREVAKQRSVETVEVEKAKTIRLAEQGREVAIAEKSKEQSLAEKEADEARAEAVRAAELVITAREVEAAERAKQIRLVEAQKDAEEDKIEKTIAAEAEKLAAQDQAAAVRTLAEADGDKARIRATADAESEKLRAAGAEERYRVEAEGKRAINEASNTLSADQIAMQVKLAIVQSLPEIIRESVKPMEAIDGIKIVQVDGLNGGSSGEAPAGTTEAGLADQVVNSALRYRAQAPLLESILNEVGLSGKDLDSLAGGGGGLADGGGSLVDESDSD